MERSGFDAMGYEVPANRLNNAYKTVKEIIPNCSSELAHSIVGKCAEMVKRDECFGITGAVSSLDKDVAKIDLTGRYRLLSVLLTG